MSGEPWTPCDAEDEEEGVEDEKLTRQSPNIMRVAFFHPLALTSRMFTPQDILPGKSKRSFWGSKCMSRCLRTTNLHPAQCHMFCT